MQTIRRLIPWLILLSLALTPLHSAVAKKGKSKRGKKGKAKKSMRLDKKMKEGYFIGVKLGLNLSWVGNDANEPILGETDTYPGLGFGLSFGVLLFSIMFILFSFDLIYDFYYLHYFYYVYY